MVVSDSPSRGRLILQWIARLIPAIIFTTAAIPKLLGAADARALFTTLGVEPWGRFLLGFCELLATFLLLYPGTVRWGSTLGLFLMTGALATHLLKIGIFYGGDASLFTMALLAFTGCAGTLWLSRRRSGHPPGPGPLGR